MKYLWFITACIILVLMSCSNQESNQIDLAGEWKFQIDSLDMGVSEKWFASGLLETIILPGSMPEQNKGIPVGYHTKFTANIWKEYEEGKSWFDDENYKPYLSEEKFRFPFFLISNYHYVGAAWYQKEVTIPENWIGKSIELYLERCHWETQVWINDNYLGLQNALGVPHRYNVGQLLRPGSNKITICVDNRVKDVNVGIDAHSVSDNTQSNWNGIIGEIKMIRKDPVSISSVQIFPDVKNKMARVEVAIENRSGTQHNAKLILKAKSKSSKSSQELEAHETEFLITRGSDTVILEYPMGEELLLWDEFNPNLYDLIVELDAGPYKDVHKETFGMRDFRVNETHFTINGRPLFLRGTLECAIFPKTGYPPTDVESWERIIKVCRAHGLNHIRFHSWCPPKAAFEAADNLGFYFQVEGSAWATVGDGKPIDEWVYHESERMIAEFGNHASFVMMAYGNEPHGDNHRKYLTQFVSYWKNKDSRRVYTSGAGWPDLDINQYQSRSEPRIQRWNEQLRSLINSEPPSTNFDWSERIARWNTPVISHEIGQWCVYPNFKEIPKYDGVLKATNFEIFQKSLEANGMLHLADDFVQASGKLQALCYKADIEAALRTKGLGGFQLLDIRDFPGQGTAVVGILDPFWDEKGYISPEEFRQFCNETVPLARFKKLIFTSDEKIEAEIEVAHYGEKELQFVVPVWTIVDEEGQVVRKGEFAQTNITWGNCQKLGGISESFDVDKAAKYQLQVDVAGFVNTWDLWVYPTQLPMIDDDILVVSTLDKAARASLEKGGKVLLTLEKGSIKEGKGGEVAVGFSSIFWNTAWTNGQQPHTLGILCDPKHPALADFPTEYHSNWQWWDAMSHSNAIILDNFSNSIKPIIRVIDDWNSNRSLALIFEVSIGKGKLIVSGIDLVDDINNRPEAQQLLYSLKKYMLSNKFKPSISINETELNGLIK